MRNNERELYEFHFRVGIAAIAVVVAFGILAARFVFLQIIQHDAYQAKAEENRISLVPVSPNRGLILDRNGVVLARNYSAYTLEIDSRKVDNLEQTIADLATVVDIQPRDRRRF
ncbi:MAG: penicillin-binding protein 2, partial [Betaproteobacteria bacterium]|nr:penicillin-binding protein 2 [Betaproteobacteria bacterium]